MNKKRLFASICALSLFVSPINAYALTKKETVYSNLNAYGEVNKTSVTNHLTFVGSSDVQDETYLKDILNVNGDEDFKLNGDKITWRNDGKDIFYTGNTDKEMPIKASIKYYLNGNETSVNELEGKSGKIRINIQLKNTDSKKVKVNGKSTTLYTPYVSTIGLVLGSDATNVSVSNGKVIETGSRSVVAGIAAPGLYDSLKLDELDDLDRVTINYTTQKFEFKNIYIVSTPKLLQDVDTKVFDKLDDLTDSIDKLQKNMDIIEDGSKKIAKGSDTLESTVSKSIKDRSKVLTNTQVAGIQKQAKASVKQKFSDEYKAALENQAWATTKDSLDNSNDSHVANNSNQAAYAILSAYFGANTEAAVACATEYATIGNPSGTYCSNYINILATSGITDIQSQLTKDLNFISTVKSKITNLATDTTYYVAEKVSKSGASTIAETAALQTAEVVSSEVAQSVALEVKTNVLKSLYGDDKHEGIKALNDGIQTLNKGIQDYNEKGICVLSKYAKKIDDFSSTAEALVELSKNYNGYGSHNATDTTFISVVKK